MNLAEVKNIFSQIKISALQGKSYIPGTSAYAHYDNLYELKRTINTLGQFDIFSSYVDGLRKSELFADRGDDGIAVSLENAKKIDSLLLNLFNAASFISEFLKEIIPNDKDDSIRIKLPPVKDFDDIAKVMNDLKKAISIPLAMEGVGQITVEHGESGSIWLFVYLGARRAVKLVAELGWAAMVILNKKNELNYVAEQLETYKLGREYIAAVAESQKRVLSDLVSGEAMGVHNRTSEGGKSLDSEAHKQLILSLNTLADLYERGFKMLPSISVGEDVKNLFPSSTIERLIESRNKQLPEGEADKDEDKGEGKSEDKD